MNAIKLVKHAINRIEKGTLNKNQVDITYLNTSVWRAIYQAHNCLIKMRGRIQGNYETAIDIMRKIQSMMPIVYRHWSQHKYDGFRNVWIIKPACSGKGQGILVSDDIEKIMRHTTYDNRRYIVQK